jgi:hypothetical protein
LARETGFSALERHFPAPNLPFRTPNLLRPRK